MINRHDQDKFLHWLCIQGSVFPELLFCLPNFGFELMVNLEGLLITWTHG